jgi:hypothetical protein
LIHVEQLNHPAESRKADSPLCALSQHTRPIKDIRIKRLLTVGLVLIHVEQLDCPA